MQNSPQLIYLLRVRAFYAESGGNRFFPTKLHGNTFKKILILIF
jgi:hypothetical protein